MMKFQPLQQTRILILTSALTIFSTPNWAQQGDLTKGAALFATHCAECHSVKEGKNKKGPSLHGAYGNKAALNATFAYSDDMKNGNLTWTVDTLSAYIANPKKVVAKGKMKYDGLVSASERTDLIAYLASLH